MSFTEIKNKKEPLVIGEHILFVDDGSEYSRNLFLKYMSNGQKFIYLKSLKWDTEFFERPSFLLDVDKSNFIPNYDIQKEIFDNLSNSFISVKLDTKINYEYINFLQNCGFLYIDTEVQLEYRGIDKRAKPLIDIERLNTNENLPYESLGSSFSLTRFHTDLHVDNNNADLLWVEYLRNFKPSENKSLYVAKVNKKVVGTVLVNRIGDIVNLFFIAVLDEHRNLGVGKDLINRVLDDYKEFKIQTETQVKNIKALNFYIQNGFFVKNSFSVLHRWV